MDTSRLYGKEAGRALGLWVKLARAFSTVNKRAAEDIRTYGLTQPQFGVLEVLGHLGPLTLSDLAKKMLISCGNTTVIVDNLEKDGLVERLPSSKDRRVIYARLTTKGRHRFKEIFPLHASHVANLMGVLSAEEQDQLASMLKKLGHRLSTSRGKTMTTLTVGQEHDHI